jgi:transposase
MRVYSEARKQSMLKKMMPPLNVPVSQLVKETGISDCTLYTWRKEARLKGVVVPGNGKNAKDWSSENKFAVVVETLSLNEAELAEYCRKKGLYVDQVKSWKVACQQANTETQAKQTKSKKLSLKEKREIQSLKKELRRKEKALAETAALLVLRKKADAIWGEDEDV